MTQPALVRLSMLCALLALAGCGCGLRPDDGAPVPDATAGQRAFYVIGHNPNDPQMALACLKQGANALEPDLRQVDGKTYVYDQIGLILGVRIPWPPLPGKVFTLEEYLDGLNSGLPETPSGRNLSLMAWDFKEPFDYEWMKQARRVIREKFHSAHPQIALLYTVGSRGGIEALAKLGEDLIDGEAIGVDMGASPAEVRGKLGSARSVTYAHRMSSEAIAEAVAMRDGERAFSLVYAWTVNGEKRMAHFLAMTLDAMIVDDAKALRGVLASPAFKDRYRLATPGDRPFDPRAPD